MDIQFKLHVQINPCIEMIKIIKPDIVVGLTEYPSLEKGHNEVSNKSYKRAICKTKSYL